MRRSDSIARAVSDGSVPGGAKARKDLVSSGGEQETPSQTRRGLYGRLGSDSNGARMNWCMTRLCAQVASRIKYLRWLRCQLTFFGDPSWGALPLAAVASY